MDSAHQNFSRTKTIVNVISRGIIMWLIFPLTGLPGGVYSLFRCDSFIRNDGLLVSWLLAPIPHPTPRPDWVGNSPGLGKIATVHAPEYS